LLCLQLHSMEKYTGYSVSKATHATITYYSIEMKL
jgi:hypothetical protein